MGETYVGVDGTGPGSAALDWAVRRAARRGDRVHLIHVAEDRSGQAEAHGRRMLAEAADSARRSAPDVRLSTGLLHGSVSRQLAVLGAPGDLLVLGTHKTGFLRGRLIGSRSVLIATAAQASVAVIPEIGLTTRRGVLVGVDRLGASAPAVIFAAEEAELLGQELSMLHAAPLQGSGRPSASDVDALLLSDAAALAAAAASPPSVITRVARRSVAEALLDAARSTSLLVLGTSHGDHTPTVAGPVAHDVLVNINAPVVIARPAG
jgi:nucleotide-binding universal stress UspA family protein